STIQIRPPGPGFAEETHSASGVALLRLTKRSRRLLHREGIDEPNTLIKKCLRLGCLRRDAAREVPQMFVKGDGFIERRRIRDNSRRLCRRVLRHDWKNHCCEDSQRAGGFLNSPD